MARWAPSIRSGSSRPDGCLAVGELAFGICACESMPFGEEVRPFRSRRLLRRQKPEAVGQRVASGRARQMATQRRCLMNRTPAPADRETALSRQGGSCCDARICRIWRICTGSFRILWPCVIGTACRTRIARKPHGFWHQWPVRLLKDEIRFILHPDHWGHEPAHPALIAIMPHVVASLPILRLEADIDPRNTVFLQLYARLGFRPTGGATRTIRVGDERCDSVHVAPPRPT